MGDKIVTLCKREREKERESACVCMCVNKILTSETHGQTCTSHDPYPKKNKNKIIQVQKLFFMEL